MSQFPSDLLPIVLWFVLFVGLWVGLPGVLIYLVYLARRFVRAQERRATGAADVAALAARVAALEAQVTAVEQSVDQIAEGQRFTTAVLADRALTSGR